MAICNSGILGVWEKYLCHVLVFGRGWTVWWGGRRGTGGSWELFPQGRGSIQTIPMWRQRATAYRRGRLLKTQSERVKENQEHEGILLLFGYVNFKWLIGFAQNKWSLLTWSSTEQCLIYSLIYFIRPSVFTLENDITGYWRILQECFFF